MRPAENSPTLNGDLALGRRLVGDVLEPMKRAFVGKDEIIDLLGVCLVAGENLFLLGPPGTAKSALVHDLGRRVEGRVFDYLLTRFTEPNELFGPFDIRKLREGELLTNTEGMLPEAALVFLDELLNANSAILNSLLTVLNERVFRRGKETRPLPTLMVIGASNRLPDDDALNALFDRFLMRVRCDNVSADRLPEVLEAGWRLELHRSPPDQRMSVDELRRLHGLLGDVDLSAVRPAFTDTVRRLRQSGIAVSDRRAVKLQRLAAASALVCGRGQALPADLWVLRYIWDTEEQQEVIAAIVDELLAKAKSDAMVHPRAEGAESPDAEALARDLETIEGKLSADGCTPADRSYLRDRLGLLAARCQWVEGETPRGFLLRRVDELWGKLGGRDESGK
ncbi:MAG TPA: AAA family ATPase [Pirellulales bacterium]|nr:AAA family ATPase [Pirellulales bacterium]